MTIGVAYGFIDCPKSLDEIKAVLPIAKNQSRVPSILELSVEEGLNPATSGILREGLQQPGFRRVLEAARYDELRYVFQAKYPGATNQLAATELGHVVNNLYKSDLYKDQTGPFKGAILYEDKGNWHMAE